MSGELSQAAQNFIIMLVTGVLGVLSAFLIALVKKGFDWLAAKIALVKNEKAQKELQEAMVILENSVTTTVTALQQLVGDDIKESIEKNDGKYTREDLLALKDKALELIKAQISQAMQELLSKAYGDFTTLASNMIETQVHNLKLDSYFKIGEKIEN